MFFYTLDCSRDYTPSEIAAGRPRLMAREAAQQIVERSFDPNQVLFERRVETKERREIQGRNVNFLYYRVLLKEENATDPAKMRNRISEIRLLVLYHFREENRGICYWNGEFTLHWIQEKIALISPFESEQIAQNKGRYSLILARTLLQKGRVCLTLVGKDEKETTTQARFFSTLLLNCGSDSSEDASLLEPPSFRNGECRVSEKLAEFEYSKVQEWLGSISIPK